MYLLAFLSCQHLKYSLWYTWGKKKTLSSQHHVFAQVPISLAGLIPFLHHLESCLHLIYNIGKEKYIFRNVCFHLLGNKCVLYCTSNILVDFLCKCFVNNFCPSVPCLLRIVFLCHLSQYLNANISYGFHFYSCLQWRASPSIVASLYIHGNHSIDILVECTS